MLLPMSIVEHRPIISIIKANVAWNVLKFYGEIVSILKKKKRLTLLEAQQETSPDVARFIRRERLTTLLGLLRILQATRLLNVDYGGWRRDRIIISATGLMDNIPLKPSDVTTEQYGAAILWGYMAKKQYITGKVIDGVLRDKPGEAAALFLPENPNVYDKVLSDIYAETVRLWPKSVGTVIGKTDYINSFKPLTDIALLLAVASISGFLLLNARSMDVLAEYYVRKKAPKGLRKAIERALGRNLMEPKFFNEAIREGRSPPEKIPTWQKLAFEIAQKP